MTRIKLGNQSEEVIEAKRRYKHIRAWGELLHSYDYYIVQEQLRALRTNQPDDVIYQKDNDEWVRFSELSEVVQTKVNLRIV